MKKYFLLFLVYLFVFCGLFAQQGEVDFDYHFFHFDIEQGLPSNEAYIFQEDEQGYIWIGTDKGVARFNGYEFKNYTTNEGLTDNTILRMAMGPDGKLWMVGYNNTLCYVDREKIYAFERNDSLLNIASRLFGSAEIDIDKDYNILFKSLRGGVIISRDGAIKQEFKPRFGTDPETYWFFRFNNATKYFCSAPEVKLGLKEIRIAFTDSTFYRKFLPHQSLSSYFFEFGNTRYLYAHETLFIIGEDKSVIEKKFRGEGIGIINQIGEDIWMCSMNGIIIMDKKGNIKKRLLKGEQISSIYKDRNNNIWISTLNNGIYQVKNEAVTVLKKNELAVNHRFPILLNRGDLVTAVNYTNETACATAYNTVARLEIFNQYCDYKRLFSLEQLNSENDFQFTFEQRFLSINPSNSIKSMAQKNGQIYAVSHFSLFKLEQVGGQSSWKHLAFLLKNKIINTLYVLNENYILLGAHDGFYTYQNGKIIEHPKNKEINSRVQDIELLGKDTILGTRGNGLKILKEDQIISYTEQNGLLNNFVNGLFKSKDTIWVATDAGVNILYARNDSLILEKKITLADGLSSKQIRQLILLDRIAFLGTEKGLSRVDLKLLDQHKTKNIPVYFTSIRINDSDTAVLNTYHLKHDQKLIRIAFEAIDFKQSGNILYRYRMIGLSDRWDFSTDRSVLYSNLSPGTYVFELSAQYTNGSWTDLKQVEFIISEPYWETWWFQISMFLIFSGLGYGIYASSSAARRKREQLSKELNTSKQMALGSQINPHFIFNSLNSIYNFLLKNKGETAQVYLVRFSRLIRNVFENSMENYISLAQEVETLKIYFDLEQLRFSNKFTYQFQIGEDIPQEDTFLPPMLLQPLAENAIWHGLLNKESLEPASLQINITKAGDMLHLEVKDNGVGFTHSKEKQKNQLLRKTKSTGLSITKKRVSLVNEFYNKEPSFTVEDLVEDHQIRGTIVAFSLPYINSKP